MQNKPLSQLADVHYGKSPNSIRIYDSNINIYGTGGIVGSASKSLFKEDGVVVGRKGTLGNPIYATGEYWVIDTAYAVIPKKDIDSKWLYYNLSNYNLESLNEATGVPSINRDWLYRIEFKTPNYSEQRKIAEILSTVDEEIEQTGALIAKYEMIKQGMMQDLFTRGVDANGKLRPRYEDAPELYKESPLGMIPKEWEPKKLEDVILNGVSNGYFKKPSLVGKGYKLINVSELYQPFGIDTDGKKVERVEADAKDFQKYSVKKGDIFFTRSSLVLSGIAQCNIIREVKEDTLYECHVMRVRNDSEIIEADYLCLYLRSTVPQRFLMSCARQVTMATISQPDICRVPVLLPDVKEQLLISERIISLIDLITEEHIVLNKYKQQKQGLIQDLLSGEVRVAV